MKRKKSKVKEKFTASNGVTIEYAPDANAGKPLTQAQLAQAKPMHRKAAGIDSEFLAATKELKKTRGRPKSDAPKQPISFRFSADLVQHLKNDVERYNVRVEHLLHQAIIEGRL